MIKRQFHFKDFDMAVTSIRKIETNFRVYQKMNRSTLNGLILTIEIDEKNLSEYLEIIEKLSLEMYPY